MESGASALMQGLGSYGVVRMFYPSANNVGTAIWGQDIPIAQLMGVNTGLITFLDEVVIKHQVIPRVPSWLAPYVTSGNLIGDAVVKSAVPIAIMRYSGTPLGSWGDLAMLAGENLLGAYAGGYIYDNALKSVVDRFV